MVPQDLDCRCYQLFVFSGYYALTTDKKYTATAMFEIKQDTSNGLNIPSEFGALASLAGLGGVAPSVTEVLMERILEREFILKASKILSLQDDPFFQTFDPNDKDPVWKAMIKNLIGWNQQDHNEGT